MAIGTVRGCFCRRPHKWGCCGICSLPRTETGGRACTSQLLRGMRTSHGCCWSCRSARGAAVSSSSHVSTRRTRTARAYTSQRARGTPTWRFFCWRAPRTQGARRSCWPPRRGCSLRAMSPSSTTFLRPHASSIGAQPRTGMLGTWRESTGSSQAASPSGTRAGRRPSCSQRSARTYATWPSSSARAGSSSPRTTTAALLFTLQPCRGARAWSACSCKRPRRRGA
mmetsp:Transcript_16112/g.39223  ORF Transcript_16112/g.39223 Transcript_16112/m.39223 type:complete len:225 (+) Transcript_16112:58-732(+)